MPQPANYAFLAADLQNLPAPLRALWHDGNGNWQSAHEEAQAGDDRDSAWVHAYLHRKEGDPGNAAYWYHRAGKPVFQGDLTAEWQHIVATLRNEPAPTR